jgi:AcrR family transcriptional regulator
VLYGAPTARRQDAQRNRAAIVRAAVEVMTGGAAVIAMPEIARRAGVGQATLYRHFPDRSALAGAVIAHQLQRLEAFAASEACRPPMFRRLLREVLHTMVAMRPLVLLARRLDAGARDGYQRRLLAVFREPLRRAQSEGYVRSDVAPADLLLLLAMVQGVTEAVADAAEARAAADRSIDLVLDGVFSTPPGGRRACRPSGCGGSPP